MSVARPVPRTQVRRGYRTRSLRWSIHQSQTRSSSDPVNPVYPAGCRFCRSQTGNRSKAVLKSLKVRIPL
jgi:hypothetical protein